MSKEANAVHEAMIESLKNQIADTNQRLNGASTDSGVDFTNARRKLANLHIALTSVQKLADELPPSGKVDLDSKTVREHLEAKARKAESDFFAALTSFVAYVRVFDSSPTGQYGSVLSIFKLGEDLEWLRRTGALRG